jgi:cellulose synthase/poly-beta-1,6-N-acetylglucosamine synthase-like glycosyltransferase
LVVVYLRHLHKTDPSPSVESTLPAVTVQLPFYNERYVARRLIDAVAQLDYPRDRLFIQVLDDSTDDTPELISPRVAALRAEGVQIELIRRRDRTGFKAGALAEGVKLAQTEFFAIFDADFIPPPDFLKRVMPVFNDPGVGMAQTRWSHLNEADNLLTRGQALAIDGHFGVEQFARYHDGLVFSFNGTGGVWRRQAIEDAGGWSPDTLCEDFDLSYRVTLTRKWRFAYLRQVAVPGELPSQMTSYKQQQSRWAKGSTQVLLKLGGPLIFSKLSLRNRVLGFMQMMQYAIQLFMLLMIFMTPPMIALRAFDDLYVLPYSLLALSAPLVFALGQMALYRGEWWRRTLYFPFLLLLSSGMSLNNGWAAFSAILGIQSEFKRTPKFHHDGRSERWIRSQYSALLTTPDILGEVAMCAYCLVGVWLAVLYAPTMIGYVGFYALSYGVVIIWSLRDQWKVLHPAQPVESEAIQQIAGR